MAQTFKVLSLLLAYPTQEIAAAAGELRGVLAREHLLTDAQRARLDPLMNSLGQDDLYALQERYVALFDRSRSLSLHLFEHVHGESRARGQAMVDLQAVYAEAGLVIGARELPDYLPLFLEFLATQPLANALDHLRQPAHILAALAARLHRRASPYAALLDVLAELAEADATAAEYRHLLDEAETDPNDLAALDEIWAEAEVRFGPAANAQSMGDRLVFTPPPVPTGPRPANRVAPRTVVTRAARVPSTP